MDPPQVRHRCSQTTSASSRIVFHSRSAQAPRSGALLILGHIRFHLAREGLELRHHPRRPISAALPPDPCTPPASAWLTSTTPNLPAGQLAPERALASPTTNWGGLVCELG